MTRYLKIDPHTESYKCEPYAPEEIDDLPNKGRVWATILAIRLEAQEACNRARELGYQEGRKSAHT